MPLGDDVAGAPSLLGPVRGGGQGATPTRRAPRVADGIGQKRDLDEKVAKDTGELLLIGATLR